MAKRPRVAATPGDATKPVANSRSARSRSRREELEAQRRAQAAKQRQRRILWTGVGTVVLAIVVAVTIWGIAGSKSSGGDVIPPHGNAEQTAIIMPGEAGAPVLDIYSDFQCPGCKSYHDVLGETIKEVIESGQAEVRYHTLTFLDSANVQANSENKRSSTRAAIGAACADRFGAYVEYYDQVYKYTPDSSEEGRGFTDDLLRNALPPFAGIAGDDLDAFNQCYDEKQTGQFVAAVAEAADRELTALLGKASTPTFTINGKNVTQEIGTASDPAKKLKELLGVA